MKRNFSGPLSGREFVNKSGSPVASPGATSPPFPPLEEAIIVSLIGLAGSAIGSLCGVLVSSKLTQYRLEQLEKKVQAHNGLVERTYRLEGEMTEVKHDIRDIREEMKG